MRKLDYIGVILLVLICISGCRSRKEGMSSSKMVKSDVDLSVDYGRNVARQSLVKENNREVIEEHIEQMAYLYHADTLQEGVVMAVRTSVDRKIGKKGQRVSGEFLAEKDSLKMDTKVTLEKSEDMEKRVRVDSGNWWRRGICLLVGIALIYGVYRWLKRRYWE